ncbi:PLP-dependent transferase [Pseudomonas capeferrum]|uniref:PLP-dependent transferase n=1 Tax=Pseudomonas capeferrum TaxID=1495066 RepID=UPI00397DA1B3
MPEMTLSKLAQVGLFPTGGIQSTQTPAMECTSYLVDTFDQLPPINEESLSDTDNDLFNGLYYGGVETPTTRQLSQRVADIEKGKFAVLTPSGQSAFNLLLSTFVKPGDHVLAGDTIIYSTKWLLSYFENRGVRIEYFTPNEAATLKNKLTLKTKLIIIENPGAFTYEIMDIRAIVESRQDHPALIVADNTWAASIFHHPLSLGADISLISMSKYHGAVEGISLGALTTKRKDLYLNLKITSTLMGNHVSSHVCSAAIRSISTLGARLSFQMSTTRKVLQSIKPIPLLKQVIHPTLQNTELHLQNSMISGYNSLLTAEFSCSRDELISRLNRLSVIKIGYGWGGAISLVNLIDTHDMPSAKRLGINRECARIYLGLEDPDELIRDLTNALTP